MAQDQREHGRRQVFAAIRRAGRIARVDLARETGISPATVTAITAELLQSGLIEESAPEAARGDLRRGRPRVDLKLRGPARTVVGMKLSHRAISSVVVDLEGTVLGEARLPLDRSRHAPAALVDHVDRALDQAVAAAGCRLADLSGLGLGMAGVVDAPRGLVHWSPNLSTRGVELRDLLGARIGLPVHIDNDANLVAIAEQHFGLGRGLRDFIVVTIESGVGMGIVVNGEVYRGTRGCGAEFGHTKVQLDGALCRCGQRGCLEAYVADYALLREAATTADFNDQATARRKLQDLADAAQAGDETAQMIFDRAGRMFAMGLANLVNLFDPQLVILSGERMQFDYLYADKVLENLRRWVVQIDLPATDVRIHKWGDQMWARGAAAYAMEGVAERALQGISGDAA